MLAWPVTIRGVGNVIAGLTDTDEERLCAVPDIEEIAAYLFTIRVLKTEEKIWWPGWEIAVFGEGVPREYFNGIAVDSF